jgi:hypothetical protein
VTRAPLGDADSASRLDDTIQRWSQQWSASSLLGIEHQALPDDRGHFHWLIRLKGEEKNVITLWLSLRQRSVHVETELMPAPEENREALLRFLMVKNAELRDVHFAIGPEEGIYLMTQIPINEVDVERLDELVGATLTYVDEIYPTAMTMGLPALYRRRPRS